MFIARGRRCNRLIFPCRGGSAQRAKRCAAYGAGSMPGGWPVIRRASSRPLGGPPLMPKWPWPNARYRPGRPRHRPKDRQAVGSRWAEAHPVAHVACLQRGKQAARVIDQDLRAPFIGRRIETGDLHRAGNAQPVLHRRHEEGARLAADRDRRRAHWERTAWRDSRARSPAARECRAATAAGADQAPAATTT